MNKFEYFSSKILKLDSMHPIELLDVGCRGCELKDFLPENVLYTGVDLFQNPKGTVSCLADVSRGLPFPDKRFNYVVALDLLEHLDDFEKGLTELLRISHKYLVVLLPNMAHIFFRFRFFCKGVLDKKYDLLHGRSSVDRHRWLTVIPQSSAYMHAFCSEKGFKIKIIPFNDTLKKNLISQLLKWLGFKKAWWAWSEFYVIEKS